MHVQAGEVQVGSSGASCATANNGAIRFSGSTLYYCTGTTWTSVGGGSLTWPLAGASDSVSAPDYAWSGHTNTGLYYNSGIGFTIAGSSIGSMTSTGLNGMAIGATTTSTGAFTTGAFSGAVTDTRAPASNTSIDGLILTDTTAASSGNQQYSPRLHFSGQGWKTNSTAASQAVDFIEELQPVQGAANPSGNLVWSNSINGGGYGALMTLTSGGSVGIGTTAPQSLLHVQAGEVQVGSSGAGCASANQGAIRYSGGSLYYCDNASTWESIDSSGTSPTGDYYIATQTATAASGQGLFGGSSTLGGILTGYGSTADVTLQNRSGTAALQILANSTNVYMPGNVGIGTTSPQGILHISGNGTQYIYFSDTSQSTNQKNWNISNISGNLEFVASNDNWSGHANNLTLDHSGNVGIGTTTMANPLDVYGAAAFGSYAGTAAPSNGLIVSGNVGIGTTAPQAALHVAGSTAIFGTGEQSGSPGNATIQAPDGSGASVTGGNLTLQAGNGTGAGGSGSIKFQTAPVNGGTTVTWDTGAVSLTSGTGANTFALTVGNNTNRLLIVDVAAGANTCTVTGITYAGTSLTQLVSNTIPSAAGKHYVYYMYAPATGANNVVVTYGGSSCTGQQAGVSSFYNVNQSTGVGSVQQNSGSSATSDALTISSATGNMVYESIATNSSCASGGGGETGDYSCLGGLYGYASRAAGAASVTMTETFSSQNFDHIAFSITATTSSSSNSPATVATITNAGNVGIGTTSPGGLFTVGNNAFEVNSSGVVTAGSWTGTAIAVAHGGTGATSASITAFNNITGFSAAGTTGTTSTNLVFSAGPTFTGTLTASALTASSTVTLSGLTASGAATAVICIKTNQLYTSAGGTACTNTSDVRLKRDIVTLPDDAGLDSIMKLRPVRFKWKDVNDDKARGAQIGLIAQEVESVFPAGGITYTGGDDTIDYGGGKTEKVEKVKGVNYDRLVVPLIKAVQELKADNDKLKAANDNLEVRLEALEHQRH